MSDTFISLNPKRDVALFDLDGTVLDTYAPIFGKHALRHQDGVWGSPAR